jgi:hypothetical protein
LLEEGSYHVVISTAKLPMVILMCWGKEGSYIFCESAYIKLKEIAKEFSGRAIAAYMDLNDYDPFGFGNTPIYVFYKNGKIVSGGIIYNGFDIDHVRDELNKLI